MLGLFIPSEVKFPTAIDWWLVALLLLAPATLLVVAAVIRKRRFARNTLVLTALFHIALFTVLCWPCHYTLNAGKEVGVLEIRSGLLIRQDIRLDIIAGAVKTDVLDSTLGLSMRRIAIISKDGRVLAIISPRDRDGFIGTLNYFLKQYTRNKRIPSNP